MLYCFKHKIANQESNTFRQPGGFNIRKIFFADFIVNHAEIKLIGFQPESGQAVITVYKTLFFKHLFGMQSIFQKKLCSAARTDFFCHIYTGLNILSFKIYLLHKTLKKPLNIK